MLPLVGGCILPDRMTSILRSLLRAMYAAFGWWLFITWQNDVYCIQGKFRPRFIFALFALWPECEFKTGLIELYIIDCKKITEWAISRLGESVSDLFGAKKETGRIQSCIITDSVVLWKIQKFDWLIPETKWHSCLHDRTLCMHNRTLCSETRIHSSRVEPEKTIDSKSIKTFHCLTERWYVAIIVCCDVPRPCLMQ